MNLYKAEVTIKSTVELNIQAEDKATALAKAQKVASEQFPENSSVAKTELALISESEFQVGSKIKHKVFGLGVIKDLSPMTNGAEEKGWKASIEFENRGMKDIALMPGRQLLEAIGA